MRLTALFSNSSKFLLKTKIRPQKETETPDVRKTLRFSNYQNGSVPNCQTGIFGLSFMLPRLVFHDLDLLEE